MLAFSGYCKEEAAALLGFTSNKDSVVKERNVFVGLRAVVSLGEHI